MVCRPSAALAPFQIGRLLDRADAFESGFDLAERTCGESCRCPWRLLYSASRARADRKVHPCRSPRWGCGRARADARRPAGPMSARSVELTAPRCRQHRLPRLTRSLGIADSTPGGDLAFCSRTAHFRVAQPVTTTTRVRSPRTRVAQPPDDLSYAGCSPTSGRMPTDQRRYGLRVPRKLYRVRTESGLDARTNRPVPVTLSPETRAVQWSTIVTPGIAGSM